MATKDELNNERELNKQKKQGILYDQQGNELLNQRKRAQKESLDFSSQNVNILRSLTEELKEQVGLGSRKKEADSALLSISRELQKSASTNSVELGNQNQISRQITKDVATRNRLTIERGSLLKNITGSEEEITSKAKILSDLKLQQFDTEQRLQDLRKDLSSMTEEERKTAEEEIDRLTSQIAQHDTLIDRKIKELGLTGQITASEVQKLSIIDSQLSVSDKIIGDRKAELGIQRNIENSMGVTGAVVEGIGGIMQRLGLRSGIFANAMEDAKTEMHQVAEEAERSGKSISKAYVALVGLKEIAKGLAKALTDPAVIVGKMLDSFLDVDKALVDVKRLSGEASGNFASLNSNIATAADVLQLAAEFTRQTGLAATSIFSDDDLGRLTEAKNLLGISADQAGRLGLLSKVTGTGIDEFNENITKGVGNVNKLTGAVVAPGQALQDVLSTSDDIALSLGGNPTALGEAASAARALGLELSKVDAIAENLLDFESSIEAELEAQLLTGKNINLAKARELALTNDLAGLSQELAKNGASAAEFANMNRIQQNSLAKALGLSREELAKTIIAQDTQGKLTDEQKKKILGVNAEQLKAISIQEKINKLVQKLGQAFSPILEILYPIVDGIAAIAAPVAKLIGQAMQLSKGLHETFGPAIVAGVLLFSRSILSAAGSLATKFLPILGKIGSGIGGLVSKIPGMNSLFGKTKDGLDKVSSSGKNLSKSLGSIGKGIGGFFKGMASGLRALGDPRALLGLAGVTLSIMGIGYALKLAAPGIEALGSAIKRAFEGLGTVVVSIGTAIATMLKEITLEKAVALAAVGGGFAALGLGLASLGTSLIFGVAGIGVLAGIAAMADPLSTVGTSLTTIAAAVAALSVALNSLETEKLEELKGLVMTTASAAPVVAATGAITSLIQGIAGTGEAQSNKELLAEIKLLREAVQKGGNVYMDGDKVGTALTLGTFRAS